MKAFSLKLIAFSKNNLTEDTEEREGESYKAH